MTNMDSLDQKIDYLPTNPGVYLFKDKKGSILYVGKAGNIKHRVSSYFQRRDGMDTKTLAMMEKVTNIETIVTDTEKEALILEDNLVKEHHPRYNVKLRDDKRYPCLRLSIEEDFPTLRIVRRIKKDRALYFGPYPSATSLKETLKLIRRLFPIRTCLDARFSNRTRPCINYEMGRCSGPCTGKIGPVRYKEIIREVKMFLEGKNKDLIDQLRRRMEEEAEQLHFEKAAEIRNQIESIGHIIEKQKIVSSDFIDQDVIGIHRQDHALILYSLFVRGGKVLGGKGFTFSSTGLPEEEVLGSFLYQYYREGRFIPEQILIPKPISEQESIEQSLTELGGKKVRILVPRKGEKERLLKMARDNAEKFLMTETDLKRNREDLLAALKERLSLCKIPRRIEAFDISNLSGGEAVGSMVTFVNGEPFEEGYRHYKIKTIKGSDDYGMMYEVLFRRYRKAVEEKAFPDLILLDGGRGQLNVAREVLEELRIKGMDLLGLAKGRRIKGNLGSRFGKGGEKVYHPQFKEPLVLGKHSPLLHLLDRIRDEAHRFALSYHRRVRQRETIRTELGRIPGVGKVRQRELLRFFGSLERIEKATVQELAEAPKMNSSAAQRVYDFFHSSSPEGSAL